MTKRRAIFLDRDGVINANRLDHVKRWDEFVFLPGVLDALRQIAARDFLVILATNQAAINRRLMDETALREIHARMNAEIERAGGCIHAIYFCPHTPEENCDCRKPRPGMYLQAAREFDLDLARSYVVGDALRDMEPAHAIGAQPILVQTGQGCHRQDEDGCGDCPVECVVVQDLRQAVEWIFQQDRVTP
ncbi:MAG: D-glycero-beta-D-manno-heptose 1,7-bisphosphate 7-phosphatase [Chloroflexi bacterium]|nr:D-glycero-beta-D-manno-heptose 1,7-bisphosphate 7-phosphatase [Chloroflexota bacterium]